MTNPTSDVETCLAKAPYDLIVVGAGPAGLTIGNELAGAPLRVLIIDAGDASRARRGNDDLRGALAAGSGHPAPDLYRVRGLGGTSRIWGGRATPLDEIDFESRSWVSSSGWPIAYSDVAAHYPRAFEVCEAGDGRIDPAEVFGEFEVAAIEGLDASRVATTLERFSRPTDFWRRLGGALVAAKNVDILTNTPVTRLVAREDGGAVKAVEVARPDGTRRKLAAGAIVLAAGGLEIPRLLLNSRDVWADGLGNANDQVGRHYMSHICMTFGVLDLVPGVVTRFDYARDDAGVYVRRRLWPTPNIQRDRRLLNAIFRTYLPDPSDPTHDDGVLSAMFLAKRLVQREYAARFSEGSVAATAYPRHLVNIACDLPELARFSTTWARRRIFADRKLPSIVRPARGGRHYMEVLCEQSPDASSRVLLDGSRDRFGERRLLVDWRFGESDVAALARTCCALSDAIAEAGLGRLVAPTCGVGGLAERARRLGAFTGHHIGTTRMSADPRQGVVDATCRVHGLANLFVASSAVFATSGQANPTLSIVAFALRLAAHLRRELARPVVLEEAA